MARRRLVRGTPTRRWRKGTPFTFDGSWDAVEQLLRAEPSLAATYDAGLKTVALAGPHVTLHLAEGDQTTHAALRKLARH